MPKLIDADELLDFVTSEMLSPDDPNVCEEDLFGYQEAMNEVRKAIGRAEDIIRCKECDHSTKTAVCWCRKMEKVVKPDWFCGDAEYTGVNE